MAKALATERVYESLFITPSDTPQKTIDAFIEKIKTTIAPSNGVLRGVQVWGRRRLTYPIKHHRDGLYIFIDYTGEPATNEALKTLFRVSDVVIRHMITDKVVLRPPYVRKVTPDGAPVEGAAPAAAPGTPAPAAPAATPAPESSKTSPSPEKEA